MARDIGGGRTAHAPRRNLRGGARRGLANEPPRPPLARDSPEGSSRRPMIARTVGYGRRNT